MTPPFKLVSPFKDPNSNEPATPKLHVPQLFPQLSSQGGHLSNPDLFQSMPMGELSDQLSLKVRI